MSPVQLGLRVGRLGLGLPGLFGAGSWFGSLDLFFFFFFLRFIKKIFKKV